MCASWIPWKNAHIFRRIREQKEKLTPNYNIATVVPYLVHFLCNKPGQVLTNLCRCYYTYFKVWVYHTAQAGECLYAQCFSCGKAPQQFNLLKVVGVRAHSCLPVRDWKSYVSNPSHVPTPLLVCWCKGNQLWQLSLLKAHQQNSDEFFWSNCLPEAAQSLIRSVLVPCSGRVSSGKWGMKDYRVALGLGLIVDFYHGATSCIKKCNSRMDLLATGLLGMQSNNGKIDCV